VTSEVRASLILHALSGHHLCGWLPGNDHKAARSAVVTGGGGWTDGGGRWGQVIAEGVGLFPSLIRSRKPADAIAFIRWAEIAQVVERGCGDGRRGAYEAAFVGFNQWVRDTMAPPGATPAPTDVDYYRRVHHALWETTRAIIENGSQDVEPVQGTLL
jgi:hypothetical protein